MCSSGSCSTYEEFDECEYIHHVYTQPLNQPRRIAMLGLKENLLTGAQVGGHVRGVATKLRKMKKRLSTDDQIKLEFTQDLQGPYKD